MSSALRHETTLGALAKDLERSQKSLLFGVVIDMSEPAAHHNYFLTKLKVIDPSFNFLVPQGHTALRFSRFCHVNIGSRTRTTAPHVRFVGDIIRLRRFRFEISDRGELVAFERELISNWMLFSPFEGSEAHTSAKSIFAKNLGRKLTEFEKRRLRDLRCWTRELFSHYSFTLAIWWNSFCPPENEGVDLVLKTFRVSPGRNHVEFRDSRRRGYTLFSPAPTLLREGEVVKLRCVDVSPGADFGQLRIRLTPKSSCMLVPDYFADARSITPHLEFERPRCGFCSVVSVDKAHLRARSLGKLQEIRMNRPEAHVNQHFVVEATLEGVSSLEAGDLFQNLPFDNQRSSNRTLVHLVLLLEQNGHSLEAHIAEHFTSEMFCRLVQPPAKALYPPNLENRKKLFVRGLQQLVDGRRRLRLALRLMLTKSGVPFYRVTASAFL